MGLVLTSRPAVETLAVISGLGAATDLGHDRVRAGTAGTAKASRLGIRHPRWL